MKKIFFLLLLFPILAHASANPNLFTKITNYFLESNANSSAPSWCITCPIFQAICKSISTTTKYAFALFTPLAIKLLALGILFALTFRILKYLTIFQEVGFMEVFGDILKFFGRALIAYILLRNLGAVFMYIINPLLNLSLVLANKIQSESGVLSAVQQTTLRGTTLVCSDISCDDFIVNGSLLSKKVCEGLTQLICNLTASTLVCGIISMYLIVLGATEFDNGSWIANIYSCFCGLLLTVGFFQLLLRLPVLFLDSIFRLGFIFILSPFYIVFWVFPLTLEYLKNAFEIVLYTCIFFVCSSAFVYIALHITSFLFKKDSNTYADILNTLTTSKDIETIKQDFNLDSNYFLSAIALCFLATKILDMAHVLTSQLVKAKGRIPELQLGSALGQGTGTVIKTATNAAKALN